MSIQHRRSELFAAALEFAESQTEAAGLALCKAAAAYQDARLAAAPKQAPAPAPASVRPVDGGVPWPFGKLRGQPLSVGTMRDLQWLEGVVSASVADESKARWREANERILAAVRAEIALRQLSAP